MTAAHLSPSTRVVVLISGRGSNLGALLDAQSAGYEVVGVISNRPQAKGLSLASAAGVPVTVVDHRSFDTRESFDRSLALAVESHTPDLIVLAGFMRVLTDGFVERFTGRMINLHPSLLPKYPGLQTHARAIDAGDQYHGASVHFVVTELDAGPVIAQVRIAITAADTPATLAERLLPLEHQLLAATVELIATNSVELREGRVFVEGKVQDRPILLQNLPHPEEASWQSVG